ncbi:SAM dependent carboxyl methyltransferase [Parasponia andersonii]|uniref:SAM dependent carboxyl methyltransferase n=1 Tax=Parasponia andersonii TaxID=3476 RepID=A0A2P5DK83_PARAD|nr:SAM dependent carboxyl methyltransferase [Parasponia andersonii]
MESKRNYVAADSHPMNGGEGPYIYVQNSKYQTGAVEASKEMIEEAITKHFDANKTLNSASSLNQIFLADLGCSTGPNTFLAVQNIFEVIQLKYQLEKRRHLDHSDDHVHQIPVTFQVFFNDHFSNDFNTLFKSLPPTRKYLAAGVPGSFHGRLFPNSSLHFVHCSYSLHWLSKVPSQVMDSTSPAWNKGRIHYTNAGKEVVKAYSDQYAEDMLSFLHARAEELVVGGLMVLLIPAVPDILLPSDTTNGTEKDLLGSCLVDMAKMGLVSEKRVDSFNLPMYYSSPSELKAIIERNEHFSIERMEKLNNPKKHLSLPNLQMRVLYLRAALEGLLQKRFGAEIMDELFNRFSKKVAESTFFLNPQNQNSIVLFVLLRRNPN